MDDCRLRVALSVLGHASQADAPEPGPPPTGDMPAPSRAKKDPVFFHRCPTGDPSERKGRAQCALFASKAAGDRQHGPGGTIGSPPKELEASIDRGPSAPQPAARRGSLGQTTLRSVRRGPPSPAVIWSQDSSEVRATAL